LNDDLVQNLSALGIAAAAAAWLVRALVRGLRTPPCRPPAPPGGGDGFVPLESLARSGGRAGDGDHEHDSGPSGRAPPPHPRSDQ